VPSEVVTRTLPTSRSIIRFRIVRRVNVRLDEELQEMRDFLASVPATP
jgi:hypothetical protein